MKRTPIALALALASFSPQSTAPASRPATDWPALVGRCFGGGDAAKEALATLAREIERDYAGAFAAWRAMPDGAAKECLDSLLSLPSARTATIVLRGRIAGIETRQGGVIDHHDLAVTFGGLEVLRHSPRKHEDARDGTLVLARGANVDAWLFGQLRANLERAGGDRVWLFHRTELRRPGPAGDTEHGLMILEWTTLPAAAAECLRAIVR